MRNFLIILFLFCYFINTTNHTYISPYSIIQGINQNRNIPEKLYRFVSTFKRNSNKHYLIVVNYHWNKYNNAVFLRSQVYKEFNKLFPYSFDLILLGPRENTILKVLNHGLKVGGEYSYYTLTIAYHMTKDIREYDGYFFVNDDAFIEPRRIQNYDLIYSFHEPTRQYSYNPKWIWDRKANENGLSFSDAFKNAIDMVNNSTYKTICNLSNPVNLRRALQDFFYISKKDIKSYVDLSEIFYKNRVFLEVAAPTINYCLSNQSIVTCNHHFWPNAENCVHYHPVKMSKPHIRELVMDYILNQNYTIIPEMKW